MAASATFFSDVPCADGVGPLPRIVHDRVVDPSELALVRTVLTDFIANSKDDDGSHVSELTRVLKAYAMTDLGRSDRLANAAAEILNGIDQEFGAQIAEELTAVYEARSTDPPYPYIDPSITGHTGATARRALGWTRAEQDHLYDAVLRARGPRRGFPDRVLEQYVDPGIWPALLSFIDEGPWVVKGRLECHFRDWVGDEQVAEDVSRGAGKPAFATLAKRTVCARRLMLVLFNLRAEGHGSPLLEKWTIVPKHWRYPDTPQRVRQLYAVPTHVVRYRWQNLCAEIGRKLGVAPGDFAAERRAIAQKSDHWVLRSGLRQVMLHRLMILLLVVLGTRTGATSRLTRGSLNRHRKGRHGLVYPAVLVYEWKHQGQDDPIWKPIPEDAAECILAAHDFFDRYTEAAGLETRGDETPMLPTRALGPVGREQMGGTLGGRRPCPTLPKGTAALLGQDGRARYVGYRAHRVRERVRQWIDDNGTGAAWLAAHGVTQSPAWVAEAMLGHDAKNLMKLYGGGSKPADVEEMSYWGSRLTWRLLTTDMGARRTLDEPALRRSLRAQRAAQVDLEAALTGLREIPNRRALGREHYFAAEDGGNVDDLKAAARALMAIDDDRERLEIVSADVRRLFKAAETQFQDLTVGDRRVVVPDDVSDRDHRPIDPDRIDEIRREEIGTPLRAAPSDAAYLRAPAWISVGELSDIDGRKVDFFKDGLRKGFRDGARGVPPWSQGVNPLTPWSTPRRRGLLVSKLNPNLFHAPAKREALDRLLATPHPAGWSPDQFQLAASRLLDGAVLEEPPKRGGVPER